MGKLKAVMDSLVALEQQVVVRHPEILVYRWHPAALPNLPAIWNVLGDSPSERPDPATRRERLALRVQLGVPPGPVGERMEQFEPWCESIWDVLDPAFNDNRPLDGNADWAERTVTRNRIVRFGTTDVLVFEFGLDVWLTRRIA